MSDAIRETRQEILTAALARLVESAPSSPFGCWEVVCGIAAGYDLGTKARHVLAELRTQAEVYLGLFVPPADWRLDDELAGAVNLSWVSEGQVFCDYVFAGGRSSEPWSLQVRPSVRRLLDAGRERFAGSFVGVRVVVPAAPGRSLLVTDRKAPPSVLAETPWWFGPRLTPLAELVGVDVGVCDDV